MLSLLKSYFDSKVLSITVLLSIAVLLNVALFFFNSSIVITVAGISIAVFFIYLFIKDFYLFILLYVLLIPISIPIEISTSLLSAPSEFLLVFISVVIFIKAIAYKGLSVKILRHPITLLIILDLIWTFVSTFYSSMPAISFKRLILKTSYLMVFYYLFVIYFDSTKNVIRVILAYSLGMIIPVLWTIFQHSSLGFDMKASFMVTKPFYPEHTLYAAALAFVATILFFIHRSAKANLQKRLLLALFVFLMLALFLSFSRAAWLSICLSLVVFLIVEFKIKRSVIFFGLSAILIVGMYNYKLILSQFEENEAISSKGDLSEHVMSLTNVSNDASNAERINRWSSAIRMTADKPILGFGPGTYQFQYAPYQSVDQLTRISTFHGDKGNAHSEFLNTSAEMGIPGLFILVSIIFTVFYYLRRIYFNETGTTKLLALAFILALVGYFFHAFVNSFLDVDKIAILVYGSFAFASAFDLRNAT